jgi:hypothetical protein
VGSYRPGQNARGTLARSAATRQGREPLKTFELLEMPTITVLYRIEVHYLTIDSAQFEDAQAGPKGLVCISGTCGGALGGKAGKGAALSVGDTDSAADQ